MSEKFVIRKVNFSNARNSVAQRQNRQAEILTIQPKKVKFQNYEVDKIYTSKLILQNTTMQKVSYKIQQPKRTRFRVKFKKLFLLPKQSIQIFVIFDPQNDRITIYDSFSITLQKGTMSIHVPISATTHSSRPISRAKTIQYKHANYRFQTYKFSQTIDQTLQLKSTHKSNDNYIQNQITQFLEKYHRIDEFVKEKHIKDQIFLGQKPANKEKEIKNFYVRMDIIIKDRLYHTIFNRFKVKYSQDKPVIQKLQGLVPQWSQHKNIPSITSKKCLQKIHQEVRKFIINYRFNKIHKIFILYQDFERKNMNLKLSDYKKHEYYCNKLQKVLDNKKQNNAIFEFRKRSLQPRQLDVDHQIYTYTKDHQFQINHRIGFDNWVTIQENICHSHQIMDYQKKEALTEWMCHPKIEQITRKGTQQQYSLRQRKKKQLNLSFITLQEPMFQQLPEVNLTILEPRNFSRYLQQPQKIQDQQTIEQLISKSLSLQKQSIQVLDSMKYLKQQFEHYAENLNEPIVSQYLKQDPSIIQQIPKQDIIDYQYLTQHEKNKIKALQNQDFRQKKNEKQPSFMKLHDKLIPHEIIMQNIKIFTENRLAKPKTTIRNYIKQVNHSHNSILY